MRGKPLHSKYLHRLLTNPVYIGKITHKGKTYDGQHIPIVDQSLWQAVQQAMKKQSKKDTSLHATFLLKGKLRHYQNPAMSPATYQNEEQKPR